MRRYTSSDMRRRFSEALDAAERGDTIVIERRNARFLLRAEKTTAGRPRRRRRQNLITYADPAVLAGQWTWTWGPRGLRFRDTRRRK